MKWTKDLKNKVDNSRDNSIRRMRTSWYISALLNYTMKKRKLENEQVVPTGSECDNSSSSIPDHSPKRTCRDAITRKELKSIQRQLAVLSDEDGDRPIHVAVANEDLQLVQKLSQLMINSSLHLDITNHMRQTPLHLAVMLGNAEITQLLLSLGASPTLSDRNGNSVLHLAVKSSNTSVLNILLSNQQVKHIQNSMDYEGYSALHYAVLRNSSSAVKMLHESGSDMNKIDGKSGRTPLIHAVLEQNGSLIDLLLNCGSCPQKADYSGRSAFEMALQIGNRQIIKILEKWMPHNDISLMKVNQTKTLNDSSMKSKKRTNVHN